MKKNLTRKKRLSGHDERGIFCSGRIFFLSIEEKKSSKILGARQAKRKNGS